MSCVFYIPEPSARGYKAHNEFHNNVKNQNAFQILIITCLFRKISIFHEKSILYFENIPHESRP